jgi:prepilin-type N-terminal cleavage/methylation domain-containing protein
LSAKTRRAFTLIELLVVIAIISVLLVAVIPAVTSLSKSTGRKGAMSNLLGTIEQARTQAIRDGQPAYLVFPTFDTGSATTLDRYNYKSFAVFEDQEDPANPGTFKQKQLTAWNTLPTGVSLRSQSLQSIRNLSDATTLGLALNFSPDQSSSPKFWCIKFNTAGAIESPSNDVWLAVFEGYVNNGNEVVTGKKNNDGSPMTAESILVSRVSGRAVPTPTPTP